MPFIQACTPDPPVAYTYMYFRWSVVSWSIHLPKDRLRAWIIHAASSLSFSSDFLRGVHACASVERRSRETQEKRAASPVSRVVICVSLAFCSTDEENRETARSLPKEIKFRGMTNYGSQKQLLAVWKRWQHPFNVHVLLFCFVLFCFFRPWGLYLFWHSWWMQFFTTE